MMAKTTVAGLLAILLGPAAFLVGIAVLLNPAAQASCFSSPPATDTASASRRIGETSQTVLPLPSGTWVRTSGFGTRVHPITGVRKLHTGSDFSAPAGTPILAVADGRVAFAGPAAGYGNLILIEHTIDGQRVASGYAHMYSSGIRVGTGDAVTAGQHIGDVGSAGYSTGAHLHFEIRPGGADSAPVDPEPWLAGKHAIDPQAESVTGLTDCSTSESAEPPAFTGTGPDELVEDPTTSGKITRRTAYALSQLRENFPDSAWSCWSDRAGTDNEHELGQSCDGTMGNYIGHATTGRSLTEGWRVTNWLKDNASALGVEYLIWQGRIWSVARSGEGWRHYNGGGMFDPTSVTGGHFDHVHLTTRTGP